MLRNKKFIIAALVLILVSAGSYFLFWKNGNGFKIAIAKRGDVVDGVKVSGKVKPAETVNLAFERSGRMVSFPVEVGIKVESGKLLAQLDLSEISATLAEAEAKVKSLQSQLDEARRGTRPEEIKIQEVKVQNAEISLEDARENLTDKIQDAYTKADDAVRIKTDQFFSNPRGTNPRVTFSSDFSTTNELEMSRMDIEKVLTTWQATLIMEKDLSSLAVLTKKNLDLVKSFLDKTAMALSGLSANSSLTQTVLDGWRADNSTARTNINTAGTNLTAAEEKLRTAQSTLDLEKSNLELKRAGTTAETIAYREASLEEAKAGAEKIRAQISKGVLRAPFAGVVTRKWVTLGEIVSANSNILSLNSSGAFKIEANVPEVEIGKISTQNPVKITFDAFPEESFIAQIGAIDPAETLVDGVVSFKVTVYLDSKDLRIKSGLTANLEIETTKKAGVIFLPSTALFQRNDDFFVKMKTGEKSWEEMAVKTGLRGQNGVVEIISGLQEGDEVMDSVVNGGN